MNEENAKMSDTKHIDVIDSPLRETSQYRDDRLLITFHEIQGLTNTFAVRLADGRTGIALIRQQHDGEWRWWVVDMPHLGPFRVRGEAVAAAMLTTFDPD